MAINACLLNQNFIDVPAFGVRRQCINDFLQASRICDSARDYDNNVNCQICYFDGCNSGSSYAPITLLIALPTALMRILSI